MPAQQSILKAFAEIGGILLFAALASAFYVGVAYILSKRK